MASSVAKHIVIILFASLAATTGRVNWSYVNDHLGDPDVQIAVIGQFLGSLLFWGTVWIIGVVVWRGICASLRKSGTFQ